MPHFYLVWAPVRDASQGGNIVHYQPTRGPLNMTDAHDAVRKFAGEIGIIVNWMEIPDTDAASLIRFFNACTQELRGRKAPVLELKLGGKNAEPDSPTQRKTGKRKDDDGGTPPGAS